MQNPQEKLQWPSGLAVFIPARCVFWGTAIPDHSSAACVLWQWNLWRPDHANKSMLPPCMCIWALKPWGGGLNRHHLADGFLYFRHGNEIKSINIDETMMKQWNTWFTPSIAVTFSLSRVVDVPVPSHFNATKPLIYRVTTCSVHAWASLADGFCKEAEAWVGRKHVSAGCALLSQNDRRPKNKSENTSLATILEDIESTVERPQVG